MASPRRVMQQSMGRRVERPDAELHQRKRGYGDSVSQGMHHFTLSELQATTRQLQSCCNDSIRWQRGSYWLKSIAARNFFRKAPAPRLEADFGSRPHSGRRVSVVNCLRIHAPGSANLSRPPGKSGADAIYRGGHVSLRGNFR